MKKIILFAALLGGFSFSSMAGTTTPTGSYTLVNEQVVVENPNMFHTGVIPPFGNVPAILYVWDDENEGEEQDAYSAAVDYGVWYASQH